MDRFFVVITVQISNPGRTFTESTITTETNPHERYSATYLGVCKRYGLPPHATATLFYSVEKMPAA